MAKLGISLYKPHYAAFKCRGKLQTKNVERERRKEITAGDALCEKEEEEEGAK